MSEKHGSLSINSDNIFPIIKKWLYSDHDIFFRELISNGCDAITKLKKLDMMGEYTLLEKYKPQVQVLVNPDEKTLKFIDNGLGMTEEALENIMDPSSQTGLGIAVKNVNDRILGYFGEESFMKYASELGKGTRVTLYLKGCAENQPS